MSVLGRTLQSDVKSAFAGMSQADMDWHAARRQELALLTAIIEAAAWNIDQHALTLDGSMTRAETILKLSYERYYGK